MTSKIEVSISPILEFKELQNAFEIKKQGLEFFFKVRNKNKYTIKKGVLIGTLALNSRIGEFDFRCHEQVIGKKSFKQSGLLFGRFEDVKISF